MVWTGYKTEALWLGLWKDRQDIPFNLNYTQDPICALGVFFSYNIPEADKLNFDDTLRNMEKVFNTWKRRKLTLIAKINIVKTLALSKLIFNASNLYVPPHVIDEANKLIFSFNSGSPDYKPSTLTTRPRSLQYIILHRCRTKLFGTIVAC